MVHAANNMFFLVTSVLNLGFSVVVKSVGIRNYLNPKLKVATDVTDVSVACDAGLLGTRIL